MRRRHGYALIIAPGAMLVPLVAATVQDKVRTEASASGPAVRSLRLGH